MNLNTIVLVQSSWEKIATIAPQAAALFYQNLFNADPTVKQLFKGDLIQQGQKLTQMIDAAVCQLGDLETLVPILQNLAIRHVAYGVKEHHYQTVGEALLKTLAQGLGDDFTPEVKEAWSNVYATMTQVMIAASTTKT